MIFGRIVPAMACLTLAVQAFACAIGARPTFLLPPWAMWPSVFVWGLAGLSLLFWERQR